MSAYQERTWSGVILASSRCPRAGISLFSMTNSYCSRVRGRISVRCASQSLVQSANEIRPSSGWPNDPVVSLSVGDTALFRLGNSHNRNKPYSDINLVGGDAFVLGGASRFAYHGVPKIYPQTGDSLSGLGSGRLNITMRVTGLS